MSENSESPIKLDISASAKADLTKVSNDVLSNLCIPASKQIGKALGNVAGLLNTTTLPIKLFNQYAKKNYEKYEEKLREVPEENIREVEPEIAIPIMEKIAYTSNDDLAELYTNLLASASQKDKMNLVHPGFINKINSMAPDEAKILELFRENEMIPYVLYHARSQNKGRLTISNKLTTLENKLNLNPNTFQLHIENLISLSLIEDHQGTFMTDNSEYEKLEKTYPQFQKLIEQNAYGPNHTLEITRSYYMLSKVGKTFVKSCIK